MRNLAFVFPGQGSQSLGMLGELAKAFPLVEQTFAEASDVLDFDLWQLSRQGPLETFNQTQNTQPAMLAAGMAVWRIWMQQGGTAPTLVAGHSLGEYTALTAAGSLEFSAVVRLVTERGRLMQEAVPSGEGAMAALVGLSDEQVSELCCAYSGPSVVEAVNFNAPGQVVIAGHRSAVEVLIREAKTAGARKTVMLPVSVPSHCSLMRPAADRLKKLLTELEIKAPTIPVIHNVNAGKASDPNEIRMLLAQQLYSPVRWTESMQTIKVHGVNLLVEAGPGKVLSGLARRIDRSFETMPLFDPQTLANLMEVVDE